MPSVMVKDPMRAESGQGHVFFATQKEQERRTQTAKLKLEQLRMTERP